MSAQKQPTAKARLRVMPQRGAAAVEFALVSVAFFTLLFGIIEFGRLLYLWNTTAEATRRGARIAAVCDLNDSAIANAIHTLLPMLPTSEVDVSYFPAGCAAGTCTSVTVSVAATAPIDTFIPAVPLSLLLPAMTTTLTTESLASTLAGSDNPSCP